MKSSTLLYPFAGLAAIGATWAGARAQVVAPEVRVSVAPLAGDANGEPVIVASPRNSGEVLVAWIHHPSAGTRGIRYRVSTTGFAGAMPPNPAVLPSPNTTGGMCGECVLNIGVDPAVATSRAVLPGGAMTGDLFLGAYFQQGSEPPPGVNHTLGLARKKFGEADLERDPLSPDKVIVRYAVKCPHNTDYDRPSLAAGPRPPEGTYAADEALYFTYHASAMFSNRSVAAPGLGSAWECDSQSACNGYPAAIASGLGGTGRLGLGNPGVVVHSGARAGRLIVASCFDTPPHISQYAIIGFTRNPPEITWTDSGGGPETCPPLFTDTWQDFRMLDRYDPFGPATSAVVMGVSTALPPFGSFGLPEMPVPADIKQMFKSAPGTAVDPHDPSNAYIAFTGRSEETPDRMDLVVAWTNTGNRPAGAASGSRDRVSTRTARAARISSPTNGCWRPAIRP